MSPIVHKFYIGSMVFFTIAVTCYLTWAGYDYYQAALEERFYHKDYAVLKPSGSIGHGLGIVGTLIILVGVFGYQIRKYKKSLSKLGLLKHWLEFHIFLCVLGSIMILFHTSFKFGGLVSISFWSMLIVVISGIIGRFIYIQIPRTMQGRELSMQEIDADIELITNQLSTSLDKEAMDKISYKLDQKASKTLYNIFGHSEAKSLLKEHIPNLDNNQSNAIASLLRKQQSLKNKVKRLDTMRQYFKYWHVAHLPFAIIMLVIMVIHVGVTLAFGYRWIF